MAANLLDVDNLSVSFTTEAGEARVLDAVSFSIARGETLGLVGESGCGKSVTSLALMRLLPQPSGHITGGDIRLDGDSLLKKSIRDMHAIRGPRIGMIFQDAMTALNPVKRIREQLKESLTLHGQKLSKAAIQARCIELLGDVGIPEPALRLDDYPHQLSGGMRQRVMIAMALAGDPDLLIADEPTTALDVTVQAQILSLIQSIQAAHGMAVIFITHDLGVVEPLCQRVAVMYAGRIVETAPAQALFRDPKHPYTQGLLNSIPRLDREPLTPLPTIEGLVPSALNMPNGCRFAPRCPRATDRCTAEAPSMQTTSDRTLACHEVSL